MVSREDVIYAYRYLLRREPEGEAFIASHMQSCRTLQELMQVFMASAEYADVNPWGRRWFITPVLNDERLMWVDLFDRYVSHECFRGGYGPDEMQIVRTLLKSGDVFVDAGANIGWFTLLASTIVGSAGAIHAFEPHPIIGDFLARTIELNSIGDMVTLHRAGLWCQQDKMTLGWSVLSENPGASSLVRNPDAGGSGNVVPLIPLDSLGLRRCDLMKVDIEGAEYQMLRGGQEFFARCRPVIMSELHGGQLGMVSGVSTGDFIRLAETMGYRCHAQQGERRGQAVVADDPYWSDAVLNVIFTPVERTDEILPMVFG